MTWAVWADRVKSWHLETQTGLVVLYCIALAFRLGAVFVFGVPDPIQSSEDGMIAGRLASGQGYTFDFYGYREAAPLRSYMPPAYVLFVAFFLRFWSPLGLGIVQAGLSSVVPLLIQRFANSIEDGTVGWLAAGMVAVYPVFIIQAARPFTMTFIGLLVMAWVALLSSQIVHERRWGWIAAGAIIGLASLIRTSMLGLVGISLAVIWLRRARLATPIRAAAILACSAAVVIAPWIVRNIRLQHTPVISTNGGFTFWNGNNPFTTGSAFDVYLERASGYLGEPVSVDGQTAGIAHLRPYPLPHAVAPVVSQLSEVALDRAFYRAGLAFIRQHPDQWVSLLGQKVISLWWFRPHIGESRADLGEGGTIYQSAWILPYKIVYAIVFPLFLAGLWFSRKRAGAYAPVYLLLAYLTLVYALFNVTTRYRWEVEPLILFFATLATWRMAPSVWSRLNRGVVRRSW